MVNLYSFLCILFLFCYSQAATTTIPDKKAKESSGAVIAAVVGSLIAAVVFGGLVVVYLRKRNAGKYEYLTGESMYAGE